MTNKGYQATLEQETNRQNSLNEELSQVQGQTIEMLHETCEAEFRFLEKLEK